MPYRTVVQRIEPVDIPKLRKRLGGCVDEEYFRNLPTHDLYEVFRGLEEGCIRAARMPVVLGATEKSMKMYRLGEYPAAHIKFPLSPADLGAVCEAVPRFINHFRYRSSSSGGCSDRIVIRRKIPFGDGQIGYNIEGFAGHLEIALPKTLAQPTRPDGSSPYYSVSAAERERLNEMAKAIFDDSVGRLGLFEGSEFHHDSCVSTMFIMPDRMTGAELAKKLHIILTDNSGSSDASVRIDDEKGWNFKSCGAYLTPVSLKCYFVDGKYCYGRFFGDMTRSFGMRLGDNITMEKYEMGIVRGSLDYAHKRIKGIGSAKREERRKMEQKRREEQLAREERFSRWLDKYQPKDPNLRTKIIIVDSECERRVMEGEMPPIEEKGD